MRRTLTGLGLMVVASFACQKSTASVIEEVAASGDDMSQTESDTAALATLHVGTGKSGSLAPASLGGGALHILGGSSAPLTSYFTPSGCVTETTDVSASKVTYVYAGCTGPWGLATLTGTIDVTYSSTGADNLTLDFSTSGFKVNGATLSTWTATAVITASGDGRSMIWNASLAGTTAGGRDFDADQRRDDHVDGGSDAVLLLDGRRRERRGRRARPQVDGHLVPALRRSLPPEGERDRNRRRE